jgi:hypothetical protein
MVTASRVRIRVLDSSRFIGGSSRYFSATLHAERADDAGFPDAANMGIQTNSSGDFAELIVLTSVSDSDTVWE